MVASIRIEGREVGTGHPVFVIAEAGVNHNGSIDQALELVRSAHASGADCVKFQTFTAERLLAPGAPKAAYQMEVTNPAESQQAMLEKLELSADDHLRLLALCRELGIVFLSTAYGPEDVDFLVKLGAPAIKLASLHCAEPSMVAYAAAAGRPVLLSVGMATLGEVDASVAAARGVPDSELALLQCTTNYPAAVADANLRAIPTMQAAFGLPVGYSDHTLTPTACIAAVALGACVIEKHFSLDKGQAGPDHSCSADPAELAQLVAAIRETELALGHGRVEPSPSELRNVEGMRRALAARHELPTGTRLSEDNTRFMRPARGVLPLHLPLVLGAGVRRTVPAGHAIDWADLDLSTRD